MHILHFLRREQTKCNNALYTLCCWFQMIYTMLNPCLPATMAGRCLGRHHNHPIPNPVRIDGFCNCWCHAELAHQIRVFFAHLAQLPYIGCWTTVGHVQVGLLAIPTLTPEHSRLRPNYSPQHIAAPATCQTISFSATIFLAHLSNWHARVCIWIENNWISLIQLQ